MSRNRVEDFGPHKDAVKLFDFVVLDMDVLRKDSRCYRLVGQQVGSADSICANIEEGFGRLSRTEFIRFLDIARGSARETLGRYKRLKYWLPAEVIETRVMVADSIIARLTTSINTLRANNVKSAQNGQRVSEAGALYEVHEAVSADMITQEDLNAIIQLDVTTPDTRHSTRSERIDNSKM